MYEKITSENVLMFAIRNYTNPHCEGEKELLVYKIQPEFWSALKSFLLFLNIIREEELTHIKADENVDKILKEL